MRQTAQDKEWQRESDAHTLAEAEVIKKSPGRLKGAKSAATKMADEAQKKATSLRSVAKPVSRVINTPRTKGNPRMSTNMKTPASIAKKSRR